MYKFSLKKWSLKDILINITISQFYIFILLYKLTIPNLLASAKIHVNQ